MGHMENWKEAESVGVDKEHKDVTNCYDADHGHYQQSDGGKPTEAAPKVMANEPKPFEIKK